MSGVAENIVLDVRDLSVILESASENSPKIAKKIPKGVSAALTNLGALPGGQRAARLIQIFRPCSTQSSPSRSARVTMRAGSEPAPGSDMPMAEMVSPRT